MKKLFEIYGEEAAYRLSAMRSLIHLGSEKWDDEDQQAYDALWSKVEHVPAFEAALIDAGAIIDIGDDGLIEQALRELSDV